VGFAKFASGQHLSVYCAGGGQGVLSDSTG
jgi:hypothetical protein